ncbi:coiled-coil domain-containing protein 134 isoform X2 [Coregonus clupeaformis]|uniref:coiled-coil domain-containing protein 134 isoform X2 n=1 Tax=Coregonus clupeaformis TaxID=59861 RepID=UPI001BDF9A72|nr:coiled-coil domain-containing protein 134 isoform X2 [Coregonus clupeaformis]
MYINISNATLSPEDCSKYSATNVSIFTRKLMLARHNRWFRYRCISCRFLLQDKRLFETKRKDQLNALKNLVELNDINQQYKIIDIMLKGLFKVLEDSRDILIAANMQADDPFPMDDKLKEAYSHVVENTAFFGDVALRFPRIVHHYYDRNPDWGGLLRWGLRFCNLTGVFTGGAHQHVLSLMSQELGIIEKSPDFTNPYRTERDDVLHTAEAFQKILREEEKRRRKEDKRKEIRKGPRISRSRAEL